MFPRIRSKERQVVPRLNSHHQFGGTGLRFRVKAVVAFHMVLIAPSCRRRSVTIHERLDSSIVALPAIEPIFAAHPDGVCVADRSRVVCTVIHCPSLDSCGYVTHSVLVGREVRALSCGGGACCWVDASGTLQCFALSYTRISGGHWTFRTSEMYPRHEWTDVRVSGVDGMICARHPLGHYCGLLSSRSDGGLTISQIPGPWSHVGRGVCDVAYRSVCSKHEHHRTCWSMQGSILSDESGSGLVSMNDLGASCSAAQQEFRCEARVFIPGVDPSPPVTTTTASLIDSLVVAEGIACVHTNNRLVTCIGELPRRSIDLPVSWDDAGRLILASEVRFLRFDSAGRTVCVTFPSGGGRCLWRDELLRGHGRACLIDVSAASAHVICDPPLNQVQLHQNHTASFR